MNVHQLTDLKTMRKKSANQVSCSCSVALRQKHKSAFTTSKMTLVDTHSPEKMTLDEHSTNRKRSLKH